MALVDSANGSIVERYTYDHFGARTILNSTASTTIPTSAYSNPYGYTSRRHDASGLMYFRARTYDSSTGEFCSRDPLGYVDGMSMMRGYFGLIAVDALGNEILINTNFVKNELELSEFTARLHFAMVVVDALQEIIGDCAVIDTNALVMGEMNGVVVKPKVKITYSDEKEDCKNLGCWTQLKAAIDSNKTFNVFYLSTKTDAYTAHDHPRIADGVHVNTFPKIPVFEISRDGTKAIKVHNKFAAILWHELIGHAFHEHKHEKKPENEFNSFNESDYYDPAVKCENEARECLGIRQRVWKYYYPKPLEKLKIGEYVYYTNSPDPNKKNQRANSSRRSSGPVWKSR